MTTVEDIRALALAENSANEARELFDEDGNSLPPEEAYWEALDAWLTGYDPRVLPIAMRAMRELDAAYANFNATGDAEPNEFFWRLRDEAQRACFMDPPPAIERKTPTELMAEKVPPRQIAYEWRWLRPDGEPDVERVERELACPGSELTAEVIEARRRFDLIQAGFVLPDDEELEPWRPESQRVEQPPIERLLYEGAKVRQVARIKAEEYGGDFAQWERVVNSVAVLMGVREQGTADEQLAAAGHDLVAAQYGEDYASAPLETHPTMEELEIQTDEETEQQPDIELPLDERIVQLFQEGNDATGISKELRVSKKRVRETIATWESKLQGTTQ